jgi:DUF971 family protein
MKSPEAIRAVTTAMEFEIVWTADDVCRLPFKLLRGECPCAACVNEFTGEKMINPDDIPDDIKPVGMEYSGNYAVKVRWSDGHDTGLFTFERLEQICQAVHRWHAEQAGS